MPRNEIRGLYFPYANIASAKTLKTAVLYFDTIAVIDPRASFCGESTGHRDLHYESYDYMDEINILVKEGIIELIDPAKVIAKFGNEITMGVIQDLHDADFLRLCEPFVRSAWVLSSAKLPDDADKWLRNMLVNVPTLSRNIIPFQEGNDVKEQLKEEFLRRGGEFIERHPELYERMLKFAEEDPRFGERMYYEFPKHLRERDPYFEERLHELKYRMRKRYYEERRPGRYDDEHDASLLREVMFDEYRIVKLPFAVGESVMIGHALAVAADGNFTPFCDEQIHLDVLKARFRKLGNSKALKAILHEYGYLKDAKVDILSQDVIAETVPSLDQVPIEAVLKFREKKSEELENFRVEMRKLITDIELNPWDSDFPKHISDIVDSKVKPALKEVENEIRGCRDAFWTSAVEIIAKVSPLPLVGSVFAGVPPAVAVGLGATLAGLTLILEQREKMRKIKRNGWAFLLDAGRLAG